MTIDKPGFYFDVPEADYHADPCVEASLSSTMARTLVDRSAFHAWYGSRRLNPDAEPVHKDEWDFGHAVHQLVLEPGRKDVVVIDADSWRGKDAQAQRDAVRAAGKVPMLRADYDAAVAVAECARQAEVDGEVLSDIIIDRSRTEVTMVWREEEYGIWCRARTDILQLRGDLIIDLKTTADASPSEFSRSFINYGYHVQEAFYRRGYRRLTGRDPVFRFVAVDKTPPYETAVFASSPDAAEYGDRYVERAIRMFAECMKSGRWPSYDRRTHYVTLPAWQLAKMEDV